MLESLIPFLVAVLLGVFTGTFTGITPGIHINLVASIIPSLGIISFIPPIYLVVFVTSMAITHTFTDFIPSIFLGCPDLDTTLSVLPGHKFLLEGRGHYALKLTVAGSLMGVICLIIIIPVLFLFLEKVYPFFNQMMAFFLIWACIYLVAGEGKNWKRALLIFLLSGIFGLITLNLNMNQSLLPVLTGLFGVPLLIESIKSKTTIPKQEPYEEKIKSRSLLKPAVITSIISPIFSILPGLGSSEAAVIGSKIGKDMNEDQFLILLGSINTVVMAVSFVTLFLIDKSRSGAAVAISSLMNIGFNELLIILLAMILSALISTFSTLYLSKIISNKITKIDYSKISKFVLFFVLLINLLVTGYLGLFILIVSTSIGLVCHKLNVRKSFLMGCLLIPAIIFYLPFKL